MPISASTAPSATTSPSSSTRSTTALKRAESQRDLVLYLPDEILVVDHHQAKAWHDRYDYSGNGFSTEGLPRDSKAEPFKPSDRIPPRGDHEPGEYAKLVTKAMESFRRGDLFEVVPGQMFYERCETAPSEISRTAEDDQPVALFLLHQSRRGRIPDRRLAGDVRARQRPPRRDLPDLRHDQARRRRHLGFASRS